MSAPPPPRPPAGRLASLFLVLVLALVAVAGRLFQLQLGDAPAYEALARDQRIRTIDLPASRGAIYDREGAELALSMPARAVYARPALVPDPASAARRLARALGIDERTILRALRSGRSFVYLARRVDLEAAARAERLDLPGIGFLDESRRSYPGATLGSQVLGFVGVDGQGLAGLELSHEKLLAGRPGEMIVEQDPLGNPIPQGERRVEPPVPGQDLVLTLDQDLQFRAQRALKRAVRRNGAKGGTVIVMEPASGEILAMASYPWFDPNDVGSAPPENLRARAVTDIYEPGSVNKVIVAAAALEEEIVGLEEVFDVADHLRVGPKVFKDAHPHPPMEMTLSDIVAWSSNVGSIQVAQRVGKPTLARYLRRFGFGRPTGIRFPGEGAGILPPVEEWWETGMGTIPIGQGVAVTPLQIATVYATIANGGVWVQPKLVRATVDAEGRVRETGAPERRRVISAGTARAVTSMLAYAVSDGTGTGAQIPGYWVAGKTGTARKPLEGVRAYSDEYMASFVGFVPAEDPRLVVAAILDEPDTVYGGIAAAPMFRDVARFALAQLRVPTSDPPARPPTARAP
ncbi:MAG TPA: penicillin-binding protein 2 [Actinomycetota bacterium]|nr:penicillin-binding protein 2 [Actinomycetota bacterium]